MNKKKLLLVCDDIRSNSGVGSMAREIVIGTAHKYDWVNLGGAINHPDKNKVFDISEDTNKHAGIDNSYVKIYPTDGYGTPDFIRQIIETEKIDGLMMITDPRYMIHIFQMENEIREKIPLIYLNIWDDLPYPMYNKPYYESCDALFAISKQTLNINKVVLGEELASEKVIKYIPHGSSKYYYPITSEMPEYLALQDFKKQIFGGKEYEFKLLYNARNIRRKSVPDLLLSYKTFIDSLTKEQAKECVLVLHTQIRDENGTDLQAVCDMMFGENNNKYNITFLDQQYPVQVMNLMYNACDATILISSNEGFGLSLNESLLCGKMIIANVTGGMQDQMRFEDEEGKWIDFTEEFGSNHFGKYKKCGKWAVPVFPNNMSLIGSIPTPYIFDDRCDFRDVAKAIQKVYDLGEDKRKKYGMEGCKWVNKKESMMNAKHMCDNMIEGLNELYSKWEPRYRFELIKHESLNKHYNKHFISN